MMKPNGMSNMSKAGYKTVCDEPPAAPFSVGETKVNEIPDMMRNKFTNDDLPDILKQQPTGGDTTAKDAGMAGNYGNRSVIAEEDLHGPGDVWPSADGMWAAMNKRGERDFFDDDNEAMGWAGGESNGFEADHLSPTEPAAFPIDGGIETKSMDPRFYEPPVNERLGRRMSDEWGDDMRDAQIDKKVSNWLDSQAREKARADAINPDEERFEREKELNRGEYPVDETAPDAPTPQDEEEFHEWLKTQMGTPTDSEIEKMYQDYNPIPENIQLQQVILNEWRENGTVWRKIKGGFGAKNRRGKLKYFKDRSSALQFARTGSTMGSIKDVVIEEVPKEPVPTRLSTQDRINLGTPQQHKDWPGDVSQWAEPVKETKPQLPPLMDPEAEAFLKPKSKITVGGRSADPRRAGHRVPRQIPQDFMKPEIDYLAPQFDESVSTRLEDYLPQGLDERNYAKEYANYQSRPDQKKNRAMRNKVRREALRTGTASKGDGKDIHHKDMNPQNDGKKNLALVDKGTNRSNNRHHPGEKMDDEVDTFKELPSGQWSTSTHPGSMSNMHKVNDGSDGMEDKKNMLLKAYLLDMLKKMKRVQDLDGGIEEGKRSRRKEKEKFDRNSELGNGPVDGPKPEETSFNPRTSGRTNRLHSPKTSRNTKSAADHEHERVGMRDWKRDLKKIADDGEAAEKRGVDTFGEY